MSLFDLLSPPACNAPCLQPRHTEPTWASRFAALIAPGDAGPAPAVASGKSISSFGASIISGRQSVV
jgi:hypothetical protein